MKLTCKQTPGDNGRKKSAKVTRRKSVWPLGWTSASYGKSTKITEQSPTNQVQLEEFSLRAGSLVWVGYHGQRRQRTENRREEEESSRQLLCPRFPTQTSEPARRLRRIGNRIQSLSGPFVVIGLRHQEGWKFAPFFTLAHAGNGQATITRQQKCLFSNRIVDYTNLYLITQLRRFSLFVTSTLPSVKSK